MTEFSEIFEKCLKALIIINNNFKQKYRLTPISPKPGDKQNVKFPPYQTNTNQIVILLLSIHYQVEGNYRKDNVWNPNAN